MLTVAEPWYRDPEAVLEEVRRVRSERSAPPAISGYRDLREVSRGGQGVVYSACRVADGRPVAVKVLADGVLASAARRRRFEREMELAAQLRHPNIVGVLDHGATDDGLPYLVMELIEGVAFDVFAKGAASDGGDASIERVVRVFCQVCDAVGYAHRHGVIHRDIKPSNVLVDGEGVPHVLDFGLAKVFADASPSDLTSATGRFLGSLPWASPEQADGRTASVDVRSDVYSLGLVLYQAVTGRLAYDLEGTGLRGALERIARAPAQRPSRHVPAVRGDLETVILRCLEKSPDERYQHVSELVGDLRCWLAGEPIRTRRDRAWRAMHRTLRRYRVGVGVAGAAAVALAAFGAASWLLLDRAQDAERMAAERLREVTDAASRTSAINDVLERVLEAVRVEGAAPDPGVIAILEDAVAGAEGVAGADPAVETRVRYAVGHAYATLARFEEAEPHLRRALALARRVHGPEHPEVAACLGRLGDVLAAKANPEATSLQEEALRLRLSAYGAEHVTVARSLGGLAYASWIAGDDADAAQADELYREAISLYERLPGDHARAIGRCLHGYAAMCFSQRRWADAERAYDRALALFDSAATPGDPYRLECMASAASAFGHLRRPVEAERLYLELAETAPRVFGDGIRPRFLWRAGAMRIDQDDPAGAERLFREAIVEECRRVAGSSPAHAARLRAVAGELEAAGPEHPGVRPYREALLLLQEIAGRREARDSSLIRELGLTLIEVGRSDEAETVLREGHGLAVSLLGDDHPALTQCKGALGICLARLGLFGEAEALLLKSYRLSQSPVHRTDYHEWLALKRLRELYSLWDRPDEARRYAERLRALDGVRDGL